MLKKISKNLSLKNIIYIFTILAITMSISVIFNSKTSLFVIICNILIVIYSMLFLYYNKTTLYKDKKCILGTFSIFYGSTIIFFMSHFKVSSLIFLGLIIPYILIVFYIVNLKWFNK